MKQKMKQDGYLVKKNFSLSPSPVIAESIREAREDAKSLCKVFGVAYIMTDKKGLHFSVSVAPHKTKFSTRTYEIWKPRMVEI